MKGGRERRKGGREGGGVGRGKKGGVVESGKGCERGYGEGERYGGGGEDGLGGRVKEEKRGMRGARGEEWRLGGVGRRYANEWGEGGGWWGWGGGGVGGVWGGREGGGKGGRREGGKMFEWLKRRAAWRKAGGLSGG